MRQQGKQGKQDKQDKQGNKGNKGNKGKQGNPCQSVHRPLRSIVLRVPVSSPGPSRPNDRIDIRDGRPGMPMTLEELIEKSKAL